MSETFRPRVIPCLLLDGLGLVKTVKFKERTYLGDPVNTVRIFNEKGADEIVLLDINASANGGGPPFDVLEEIASEAFMPLAYGGGITSLDEIRRILNLGYEKVVINTHAAESPDFINEAAKVFGRSTIVVSVDVRRGRFTGSEVWVAGGRRKVANDPVAHCVEMARRGAGEILLTSIDRDGTGKGYDLELVRKVAEAVSIPVVACGGAAGPPDLRAALDAGASAAAAGSMFVFNGKHRAVLITYPPDSLLEPLFR